MKTQCAGEGVDWDEKCPPPKHAFLGQDMHGDQRLLVPFCPKWQKRVSDFEKKTFWLLNKVLEGGHLKKSLLKRKRAKNRQL